MVKTMRGLLWMVAAGALFVVGCGKGKTPPPPEYNQVTVNLPKLQQAFVDAPPEVKESVSMVQRDLRYSDYPKALISLDELVNNPAVTAPQKKVVNEVIDQVKKVISQASPAAPAAQ
jgi:PBP1b-binding outer membrane lipoprotein LpoB